MADHHEVSFLDPSLRRSHAGRARGGELDGRMVELGWLPPSVSPRVRKIDRANVQATGASDRIEQLYLVRRDDMREDGDARHLQVDLPNLLTMTDRRGMIHVMAYQDTMA